MIDVRATIRALLALSESSNEHEAANAARAAARLLDAHRMTVADLQPEVDALAVYLSESWSPTLFAAIGTRCAVLPISAESKFYYVGYPADVHAASFLFLQTHTLVSKMTERAWREHEADLTDPVLGRYPSLDEPGAREGWQDSFAFGCVLQIHQGLLDDLSGAQEEALAKVRVHAPEDARRYAEQRFGRLQGGEGEAAQTLLPGAVREGQRAWPQR